MCKYEAVFWYTIQMANPPVKSSWLRVGLFARRAVSGGGEWGVLRRDSHLDAASELKPSYLFDETVN
jgi:hypothetical protein